MRGVVAAGHPLTAKAGADAIRAGGNAVDGAIAAMLASCVAEPLLTGLGASGYMLVAPPGGEPVLLDFSAEAPGRGVDVADRAPLKPFLVNFGDAVQEFHVGASSCATFGVPAGIEEAAKRFGSTPLHELVRPAVRLAQEGVRVNRNQAYVYTLIGGILGSHHVEGDLVRDPELAESLVRLGDDGAEPFYTGDIATAIADEVRAHGGLLGRADLAAYRVIDREPLRASFRGRDVYTNPPPSAGGALLAHALEVLPPSPDAPAIASAMLSGLLNRMGSTTHISVLDADGMACTVTCTNGEGSGVQVRGTGVHLNNMMGEEDLSPAGFFTHLPGDRLPSMMAPTVVVQDGEPELVLGSAGSSRISGAILQVIVNVLDRGMRAQEAVDAPRLHAQDGVVYVEPGVDTAGLGEVSPFRAPNMFFGGCQVVQRVHGELVGGGDHRRGGVAVVA
ncbi:gamma-glutamyltranspeptidase [Lentzea sp. NBRC 105346]|uniref:gamma-glutamyltransferase family protein n=1 Tax=Lentzea sp. NBRC 105346 TaxID=3032205 RepID=UPI0024A0ECDA|nr:gamma-glutamyltransferase [Lentzea sp. NBRC 105346]GLZ31719.1 gamma-glutamyltranspeptidase [Lentzea sp. NBRC 105346]